MPTNSITSEIITVTPELATKWLKENNIDFNRNVSPKKVLCYVNTIKEGRWKIGDALKFDKNGFLIDGQHRLKAVASSQISVDFLVLKGFDTEAAQVLDRGFIRTLGNVAQLKGHSWITTSIVSVFNALFFAISDSPSSFLEPKLTDEDKINAMLACQEGLTLSQYKYGTQGGKQVSASVLKAVVARAYYSPKSDFYYYKGSGFKKKFVSDLLKDFLLIVYGYSYYSDKNIFFQTDLDPSAPTRLREMFLSNNFPAFTGNVQLNKVRFKYCEVALFKFLTNTSVKSLVQNKDNLFSVSWIDDLTFDKPN
jgi:hypothetical protein